MRSRSVIDQVIAAGFWNQKLRDESKRGPIFGLLCSDTYYGVGRPGRKMTEEEELEDRRVRELEWKSDNLWREVDAVLRFEPWMTKELEDAHDD